MKKSQDEQNALQEKIRTLAGVMTRKVELAQARMDKKKARMAVVENAHAKGLSAKSKICADFTLTSACCKSKKEQLANCPDPVAAIVDTTGDMKNPSNKAPVWINALCTAFERNATMVVLVVLPENLSKVLAETALSKRGVGLPCSVGASFGSLRLICTSGGGVVSGTAQWVGHDTTIPDAGLLQYYFIPVYANPEACTALTAVLNGSLSDFDGSRLPCGDGREVVPRGAEGRGAFMRVTPNNITFEMSGWVERGALVDEPLPLAFALSGFLSLRSELFQHGEAESEERNAIWLFAGKQSPRSPMEFGKQSQADHLPDFFRACRMAKFAPFAFLDADSGEYEGLKHHLECVSYFYSDSVANFFRGPRMPHFTLYRLLSLMASSCANVPELKAAAREFLATHSRDFAERGDSNLYASAKTRQLRIDSFCEQAATYGITAMKIKALQVPPTYEDEEDSPPEPTEQGAFLMPMSKYSGEDNNAPVYIYVLMSKSFL